MIKLKQSSDFLFLSVLEEVFHSLVMSSGLRLQVLAMYRRLLRVGRRWQAKVPEQTATERAYITEETKKLFRQNAGVSDAEQVRQHLLEAETRLTMAEHYRIPYPRPVNLPARSFAPKEGKKKGKAIEKLNERSKPVYVKSIDEELKMKKDRERS